MTTNAQNPWIEADAIAEYFERGFLRIPQVFDPGEVEALRTDLDWMIERWANHTPGWSGGWRNAYMDEATESKSTLIAMHDLHFYSQAWMKAITQKRLCGIVGEILGGVAELHHSTMHVKPPETGHPFPVHQDWWFYKHADDRYVDVLVHLDDTSHDCGEIRFIEGSHRGGVIPHITEFDGDPCTPHLDPRKWNLDQTVPLPAQAGDVVLFNIFTVHGSHINRTDRMRRMVRIGYRHPENKQTTGQSCGRPGIMVYGRRERIDDAPLLPLS